MRSRNERVELEMKILRYRKLARQIATDPTTQRRIEGLILDLEKELREIDETLTALARRYVERIGNPKKRPKGSIPIELLFFAYPRPPHRSR